MSAAERKKILIVEDDADQLLIRALVFERHGFDCIQSADASDAMVAAREHFPDCVLMDLHIPAEQDGVRLVQSLQDLAFAPAIVIISGQRTASLRASPGLRQVAAIIEKGSSTADLIAAVKSACG